jgi:S-methylmethionine-dependent homocysteine/selenocysteine methylase/SAM-dependent methyltransferase
MTASTSATARTSAAYERLEQMIADDRLVILDGGVATELQRHRSPAEDGDLWGTWALYRAPRAVLEVHRSYAATGCHVISTDTWSILSAAEIGPGSASRLVEAQHWMDIARMGVRLARQAVDEAGRTGECAVAFAISEETNSPERRETLELLTRALADDPPDLILMETMTLIREPRTFETIELLLETGLPVWLSFRRCRHGVCGVQGQHWGPPEGDLFGRAARRFEEMGAGALLINCLPVEHVPGMISWLRDFTTLPLGVYPNLGDYGGREWRFDELVGPAEYATLARGWRDEGAQIIGGCCGVTPEHVRALVTELGETKPGNRRPLVDDLLLVEPDRAAAEMWRDDRGRSLYPLPFPDLAVEEGVFVPTTGSYLVWKSLFTSGVGEGLSCMDVGCGCGILAVQLALNGAERVHAIDIDRNAVANTLANAFRNGVSDRVTGEAVNFFHWEPRERFDLVVASLYQMPVDPYQEPTGHRPLDYWGRNLIDHFIRLLPSMLAPEGTAFLMQLSIIGQAQTEALLAEHGLAARVVDYSFFPFEPVFEENRAQIERVEQLSDAYHIEVADEDVMVAYLLEIGRVEPVAAQPS